MNVPGVWGRSRDVQRRSPPSIRSRTKKQFSSSWNAYRRLTTNGWSICKAQINFLGRGRAGYSERDVTVDLFEKPPLLDDIAHRLHLYGLHFVDVLECVRRPGLFVLNDSDLAPSLVRISWSAERDWANLAKSAFADDFEQPEVKESDLAVKVDGLRATTDSPHGVGRGEREGDEGMGLGQRRGGSEKKSPVRKRHLFIPCLVPNPTQSVRAVEPETRPARLYVFPPQTDLTGHAAAERQAHTRTMDHSTPLVLIFGGCCSSVAFFPSMSSLLTPDTSGMYGHTSNCSDKLQE